MKHNGSTSPSVALSRLMSSRKLTQASRLSVTRTVLETGIPMLDHFLPMGGYPVGAITEWVGSHSKHTLASFAVAHHSRRGPVACLSLHGVLNPLLLEALDADLTQCFFGVESDPKRFCWLVEQVAGSGLFPLLVVYASHWHTGVPVFEPVVYRRLLASVKGHAGTVLVLLESNETLPFLARTAALRLRIEGDVEQPHPGVGTPISICVEKSAGYAPGQRLSLLLPVGES